MGREPETLCFSIRRAVRQRAPGQSAELCAVAEPFKFDALNILVRDGAVASTRSDILHIKIKIIMLIHVAWWVLSSGVQVIYRVGVEGG